MPIAIYKIEGLVTQTELLTRLGWKRGTFEGRLRNGNVPPPSHKIPGRRREYYTEDEAQAIVEKHRNR